MYTRERERERERERKRERERGGGGGGGGGEYGYIAQLYRNMREMSMFMFISCSIQDSSQPASQQERSEVERCREVGR